MIDRQIHIDSRNLNTCHYFIKSQKLGIFTVSYRIGVRVKGVGQYNGILRQTFIVTPYSFFFLSNSFRADLLDLLSLLSYRLRAVFLIKVIGNSRIEKKENIPIEEPKVEKKMTWEDYTKLAALGITAVFVMLLVNSAVKGLIRRKKNEKAD